MFDRLKIYRNSVGAFIHRSANVGLSNCYFSDNGLNIDIEQTLSPPIRLNNVTIIGESDTFRNVVLSQKLDKVCNTQLELSNFNIGIETRTWKGQVGGTGSIWQNIRFRNFNHSSCQYVSPISMDYTVSCKILQTFACSTPFLTNVLLFHFENCCPCSFDRTSIYSTVCHTMHKDK
jgi:hypothetical protein